MAPKLPPPANTKAVFAGAWFDIDKVLFAPAVDALTKSHAAFGWVYSSRRAGYTINNGCCDTIVIRPLPNVVPAKAGTHNHQCALLRGAAAPAVATDALVVGSRIALAEPVIGRRFAPTRWLACRGRRELSVRRTPSRSPHGRA